MESEHQRVDILKFSLDLRELLAERYFDQPIESEVQNAPSLHAVEPLLIDGDPKELRAGLERQARRLDQHFELFEGARLREATRLRSDARSAVDRPPTIARRIETWSAAELPGDGVWHWPQAERTPRTHAAPARFEIHAHTP